MQIKFYCGRMCLRIEILWQFIVEVFCTECKQNLSTVWDNYKISGLTASYFWACCTMLCFPCFNSTPTISWSLPVALTRIQHMATICLIVFETYILASGLWNVFHLEWLVWRMSTGVVAQTSVYLCFVKFWQQHASVLFGLTVSSERSCVFYIVNVFGGTVCTLLYVYEYFYREKWVFWLLLLRSML